MAHFLHNTEPMRRLRKALTIAVVSWGTLTIVFSGVHGLVLCTGADGHVAIEIAHDGHCGDAHEEHEHPDHGEPTLVISADAQCCPPCDDVPLSSEGMSYIVSKVTRGDAIGSALEEAVAASATEVGLAWHRPGGTSSVSLRTASRASPSLLALRTIVLRI
jgi:hypothetical protein